MSRVGAQRAKKRAPKVVSLEIALSQMSLVLSLLILSFSLLLLPRAPSCLYPLSRPALMVDTYFISLPSVAVSPSIAITYLTHVKKRVSFAYSTICISLPRSLSLFPSSFFWRRIGVDKKYKIPDCTRCNEDSFENRYTFPFAQCVSSSKSTLLKRSIIGENFQVGCVERSTNCARLNS